MIALYLSAIDAERQKNKFEQLYTTYRKLMFFVANRILKDPSLAEDAIHQAFLKIMENLDKIEQVHCHKTKAYVVIIARNSSINVYSKRKRSATIPLEQMEVQIFDASSSQSDDMDCLAKAVMELPIIYKDVLKLKYDHEMANAKIAQTLGISEAAVRKRLERARHKLEETLKKEKKTDVL